MIDNGQAVVVISHDRAFVDHITTRTIEVTMGRIYDYKVNYSQYLQLRKERREQQQKAYDEQQKMIAETREFIERFKGTYSKTLQVQSRVKMLEKLEILEVDEEDTSALRLKFPPSPRSGSYPVTIENVSKAYGDHTVFRNANLMIERGDKIAFVGKNGEGKSTLVKCIMKEIEHEGTLTLGHNVMIGYFAQNQASLLDENLTVFQTIDDVAQGDIRNKIKDLLGAFMFGGENSAKKVKVLSGGEKVKAQMMRLLMEDATVLLLDEPSNDIDLATLELLEKLIREWEHIVVFISHDETLIENTANMVIHIEQIVRKTKSRYTVAKLPYRTYVEERLQNFERQEQKAQSDRREKALRDEKYRKVYQSVENALNNCSRQAPSVAKNLKDKMHTVKAMNRRFEKEDARMTEMPEQEEAIYFQLGGAEAAMPAGKTVIEYQLPKLETPDGERVLAENITLKIRGPEKICIVGPNGAGKTTLLKLSLIHI